MKLLLRVKPELCDIETADGETAHDIARSMGYDLCVDLVRNSALILNYLALVNIKQEGFYTCQSITYSKHFYLSSSNNGIT